MELYGEGFERKPRSLIDALEELLSFFKTQYVLNQMKSSCVIFRDEIALLFDHPV